ncbi:MAG TPA: hypothetical protein PKA64_02265 [Myxococcota bacterium]|nr:hypothetical protein [Myxococcota bacterium]
MSVAQGSAGGSSPCAPVDSGPEATDDTATDVTLESGRLEDNLISLDWRLYGAWDGGACLDLKFTNLGDRVASWQFDLTFDEVVKAVSYPGPNPSSFTVSLDQARVVPFDNPQIQPFGIVSYPVCLEPIVRPKALRATVQRDAGTGADGDDDAAANAIYGYLFEDTQTLMLTWLGERHDGGEVCLDLRLANLTRDREIVDWNARIRFSGPFVITSTDTSYFYFPLNLDQLELRPTATTLEIDPIDIHSGELCFAPEAVPISFEATFETRPWPRPATGGEAPPALPPAPAPAQVGSPR